MDSLVHGFSMHALPLKYATSPTPPHIGGGRPFLQEMPLDQINPCDSTFGTLLFTGGKYKLATIIVTSIVLPLCTSLLFIEILVNCGNTSLAKLIISLKNYLSWLKGENFVYNSFVTKFSHKIVLLKFVVR